MSAVRRVAVIGAGVSGLSVAVALQETAKYSLTLFSDLLSPHTTSDKATGILAPYGLGNLGGDDYREKEKRWFKQTFDKMMKVYTSEHAASAGVTLVGGYHMWPLAGEDLWYRDVVIGCRDSTEEEKSTFGFEEYLSGFYYQTFLIDCRLYLPWLMRDFVQNSGKVIRRKILSLSELDKEYDLVVNCTGLGSSDLVGDNHLTPFFGQTVSLDAPWLKNYIALEGTSVNDENYILITPRSNDVLVGGVSIANRSSCDVDEALSTKMLEDAYKLVPSLKYAKVLGAWTGLRPCREKIRLEFERLTSGLAVVHNYGHGGNGVNYSWGCATEVRDMIEHVQDLV